MAATDPCTLALISMPWSLFNRPSIQLGALKAYVEHNSDMVVDCFHPYLGIAKSIGTDTYTYLSKNSWAGEALYSSILFPKKAKQAEKLFQDCCDDNPEIAVKFNTLRQTLEKCLSDWIAATDLSACRLIGFSICFSQLFASLAAAQKIKEKLPGIPIVFGGSSCVGSMGQSLMQHFPQVDLVIAGEGEEQLLEICRTLIKEKKNALPQCDQGDRDRAQMTAKPGGIVDLDTLPTPDYRPYFEELERVFPGKPFSPTLPLEFSRGCWWRQCTFCNLNLQWHGYRRKSSKKMIYEVRYLQKTHQCLDFTFCDNALPPKEADAFFSTMGKDDRDYRFFAEIRAIKDPEKLALYRRGGLAAVQVGIESLSNSLLAKMKKGTSVIENLAVMKFCAENSITLDGNLIIEFPGSSEKEAEETLANLEYALSFHPLSAATFFLGSGSAVDEDPSSYDIRAVTGHAHYSRLVPREILENLDLLIKDYRGDKAVQRKRWQPVREKIREWREFHHNRGRISPSPLSYRDGGFFLLIRQERANGAALLHRLRGTSRKLYLFCQVIRDLDSVTGRFPELSEKTILNFFDDLSKKKLLYRQDRKFLALAMRARV